MRSALHATAFWLFTLLPFSIEAQSIVSVTVDTKVKYQELDGFGCSQAFQRAEDVFGKYGLSPANTEYVLDLMFSVERGAGFSILRNGIGSSNSSKENFMNSIEPFSPGSPTDKPNYVWDRKDSGQLEMAQKAYARGLTTLYCNAWSAPGYMKTNLTDTWGGYLCGVSGTSCATGNWMQAYANYLVQYAKFYEQSGVKCTNIGFLNEPQLRTKYASMLSNGEQAADFIRVLAKTIKSSGLDLKINCCDGEGWQLQEAMMPALMAGPDPAINYLSVVTGHGYVSPPDSPLTTGGVKTWQSEWTDLSGAFTPWTFYANGGAGEGMTWATRIQVALVRANVSGFLCWIGAEDAKSNSGLISMVGDKVYPSKRFWAFASFSKFARPGARRVQATSSVSKVTVSSFLNTDGSVATQLINTANVGYQVGLQVLGCKNGSSATPYLTDNANNLTALAKVFGGSDCTFHTSIPALSLVSLVVA